MWERARRGDQSFSSPYSQAFSFRKGHLGKPPSNVILNTSEEVAGNNWCCPHPTVRRPHLRKHVFGAIWAMDSMWEEQNVPLVFLQWTMVDGWHLGFQNFHTVSFLPVNNIRSLANNHDELCHPRLHCCHVCLWHNKSHPASLIKQSSKKRLFHGKNHKDRQSARSRC